MKRYIYSVREIEEKASETYRDRQLKKDWLAKHIEVISSKTVLKDLKLGQSYHEEAVETTDKYEAFRLYQQSLAHYFLAYFRSHGKDRRAERELEKAKEEYYSHLFNYFLKVYDDFDYYLSDFSFLNELVTTIREGENRRSIEDALLIFDINKGAFELYSEVIEGSSTDIEGVRERYKYYKEQDTRVCMGMTQKLQKNFQDAIEFLDTVCTSEEKILRVDRKKLQDNLKYIRYFNSKTYNRYRNIVSKFFTIRTLKYFIDNEFTYEDYEGLKRNYVLFEKVEDIDEESKLIELVIKRLKKSLHVYSQVYVEHNIEKILSKKEEVYTNYILLVEKFLRKLESKDFDLVKELDQMSNLDKEVDICIKVEELLNLLEKSQLSFRGILEVKLREIYRDKSNKLEGIDNFSLKIIDKKMDKNYLIYKKDILHLGRGEANTINIDNKHISREHLAIDLKNNLIKNGRKKDGKNLSFYNNKRQVFDTLDIVAEDVRELNIGNLFTYSFDVHSDYIIMDPIEEKTNVKHLTEEELKKFKDEKFILLYKEASIGLDTESFKVEEENQDLSIIYNKGLKVKVGNKMPRTIKFGLNYFDNRYEYILEKI